MNIPLWKQTLLTPEQYSQYANLGEKTVYQYCHKGTLPCIKVGSHIKIHREGADRVLEQMAANHEGFEERNRAEEINGSKRRRRLGNG